MVKNLPFSHIEYIEADAEAINEALAIQHFAFERASLKRLVATYVYEDQRLYPFQAAQPASYAERVSMLSFNDPRRHEAIHDGGEGSLRVDLLHHLFKLTLCGAPCLSKLDSPRAILDIHTGSGIWPIDMSEVYPSATITGTDSHPIIKPRCDQPPRRVFFLMGEVDFRFRYHWATPGATYDFVHARCLAGDVYDWPTFLQQCYSHLKPGGRLEVSECRTKLCYNEAAWPLGSQIRIWAEELESLNGIDGAKFDIMPEIPEMLQACNFTDIATLDRVVPIGPWARDPALKEIGRVARAVVLDGSLNILTDYTNELICRMSEAETKEVLRGEVVREIMSNKHHVYTTCSFVTAKRPDLIEEAFARAGLS